jgi:Fic family protein
MPSSKPSPYGTHIQSTTSGELVNAFMPAELPLNPPLDLSSLESLLEKASRKLGELNGMASLLPNVNLFLYHYIRQEALLSSQIEGTQSSYHDLMLHEALEAPSVPLEDVEEVSTYIQAIQHGITRLQKNDFPLSLRLIREVHEKLLNNTRGMHKQPGEFRQSQNWIGGSRPSNALFVPPPPEKLADLLKNLEAFIHEEQSNLPHLVKVAMLHLQFETIHPFLDGNGRVGRLLITLYLIDKGLLDAPILYLSLYLKTHRHTYYRLLQDVRLADGWLEWIRFFLQGIIDTCNSAMAQTKALNTLISTDEAKLASQGRQKETLLMVFHFLLNKPVLSIPYASEQLRLSQPTVTKAFQMLEALGIVQEESGKQRGKLYGYSAYLRVLTLTNP